MNSSGQIRTAFDIEVLSRIYLSKKNIAIASTYLKFTFQALLLCLVSYTVWFLLTSLLAHSPHLERAELTLREDPQISLLSESDLNKLSLSKKDVRIIKNTKLFGFATTANTTQPEAIKEEAPVAPLTVSLIGTFVSSGSRSVAILEDTKLAAQEVFGIGDDVFGQGTLKDIKANSIDLLRNGVIETIVIDDSAPSGGGSTPAPSGAEQIVVQSAELNSALDNLPLLLTQARAVPYFKQGEAVGLRLFAIKTGSLYEKIGLKNGDIIKTINGNNLGDFSQAMKLFEQLRDEKSLNLSLERNREEKVYHYTIR